MCTCLRCSTSANIPNSLDVCHCQASSQRKRPCLTHELLPHLSSPSSQQRSREAHTYPADYCDVVWSGCTKFEASKLETHLNYACRTVLRKRRGSSTSAAHRELGLSTLASRRKLQPALTILTVCPSSPLLIFLSFFLCLHPTTTFALLHLLSSTFYLINLPLAKNHSVSCVQDYGDPCHQTSGKPENSTVFTHFASIIL